MKLVDRWPARKVIHTWAEEEVRLALLEQRVLIVDF